MLNWGQELPVKRLSDARLHFDQLQNMLMTLQVLKPFLHTFPLVVNFYIKRKNLKNVLLKLIRRKKEAKKNYNLLSSSISFI